MALAVITAAQRLPAVPLTWNTFVVFAGMLAVVLVLVRVIDLPDGAGHATGACGSGWRERWASLWAP